MKLLFTQDSNAASRLSLASVSIPLHILDLPAPKPVESVTQGIRKNCPLDFACIINPVKSSEATSGNIAFVVELLRNISTQLSDEVTREKMKVLTLISFATNNSVLKYCTFLISNVLFKVKITTTIGTAIAIAL